MRFRPLLLSAALLLFTGCDQVGDDLFTFDVDGLRLTFSVQGDAIDGSTVVISSDEEIDLLDEINDEGFGIEEVSRVTLKEGEAQIRIVSAPSGVDIGVLDAVSLRLQSPGGGSSIEVASADEIETPSGMVSEVDLDVTSENIASLVAGGPIEGSLTVSGDSGIPDGIYTLEVRFDVEVAVDPL